MSDGIVFREHTRMPKFQYCVFLPALVELCSWQIISSCARHQNYFEYLLTENTDIFSYSSGIPIEAVIWLLCLAFCFFFLMNYFYTGGENLGLPVTENLIVNLASQCLISLSK
jgi:hypothetical protein